MVRDLSLDAIGILEGTNKTSLLVDYLRHYERLFSDFADDPINIIEIGVYEGASLRTWARFFPRATIVGIDILDSAKQHANGRIKVEIGDQADLALLMRVCTEHPPKIVIDDGSHRSRDVLFSFQAMFPFVLPGGFYIIEDVFYHYGANATVYHNAPVLPSDHIFRLAHNLLAGIMESNEYHGLQRYLFDNIDSIEIIWGAILIRKKNSEERARTAAEWWPLILESDRAINWILVAQKLLQNNGPLERTEEALRKCIELEPGNLHHHYYLADVLDRRGDVQGAISSARRAVELSKNESNRSAAQSRLDGLIVKAGRRME